MLAQVIDASLLYESPSFQIQKYQLGLVVQDPLMYRCTGLGTLDVLAVRLGELMKPFSSAATSPGWVLHQGKFGWGQLVLGQARAQVARSCQPGTSSGYLLDPRNGLHHMNACRHISESW